MSYDAFRNIRRTRSPIQNSLDEAALRWMNSSDWFNDDLEPHERFKAFLKVFWTESFEASALPFATFYRGLNVDTSLFKIGQALSSKTFTSFSHDRRTATGFGNVLLKVNTGDMPPDCPVLQIQDGSEKEVVFPPGILTPIEIATVHPFTVVQCKFHHAEDPVQYLAAYNLLRARNRQGYQDEIYW